MSSKPPIFHGKLLVFVWDIFFKFTIVKLTFKEVNWSAQSDLSSQLNCKLESMELTLTLIIIPFSIDKFWIWQKSKNFEIDIHFW